VISHEAEWLGVVADGILAFHWVGEGKTVGEMTMGGRMVMIRGWIAVCSGRITDHLTTTILEDGMSRITEIDGGIPKHMRSQMLVVDGWTSLRWGINFRIV